MQISSEEHIRYINVSPSNSEQSRPCVNRSRNIDAWLLRKTAVCSYGTQWIDNKTITAPVSLSLSHY